MGTASIGESADARSSLTKMVCCCCVCAQADVSLYPIKPRCPMCARPLGDAGHAAAYPRPHLLRDSRASSVLAARLPPSASTRLERRVVQV